MLRMHRCSSAASFVRFYGAKRVQRVQTAAPRQRQILLDRSVAETVSSSRLRLSSEGSQPVWSGRSVRFSLMCFLPPVAEFFGSIGDWRPTGTAVALSVPTIPVDD